MQYNTNFNELWNIFRMRAYKIGDAYNKILVMPWKRVKSI